MSIMDFTSNKRIIYFFINIFQDRLIKLQEIEKQNYELIYPIATYSPWNGDKEFNIIYDKIKKNSVVDKYRCFELWKLVEECSKLSEGNLIEIGVWRGGTGALIAKKAKLCGIQEKVFLCDTFKGVVKAGYKDHKYRGGEFSDTTRNQVEDLIFNQMYLDNVQILEGIFPDETGFEIDNHRFRYCHIDVDVYQSAKDTVEWIWEKMVKGGIIIFDDYGFDGANGVTDYVEELMLQKDRLILYNLNGHAIMIKL